jgi:hypothetical protein
LLQRKEKKNEKKIEEMKKETMIEGRKEIIGIITETTETEILTTEEMIIETEILIIEGMIEILIIEGMIAKKEKMNGSMIREMIKGEIQGMTQIIEREVTLNEHPAMI